MTLWTPSYGDITPAIWLDASDSSTITIATGVSQINDKSGNGRNLTQATAASQPAGISAAQNGLDVIRFDGSNDELTRAAWFPNVFTVLLVAKNNNLAAANSVPFSQNTNTLNAGRLIGYIERDSGTIQVGLQVGTFASKTGTRTGSYNLYGYTRTGTTAGLIYNGVSAAGTVNANTVESTTFRLGQGGGSMYCPCDFCEMLVFSSVLSLTDRQLYEGYLAWKWGIQANLPAGHPYESAAPVLPTALRTILEQPYDLQPYLVRAILEQPYGLMIRLAQIFDQIYGLRMLVAFEQRYGDAAKLRSRLDQYYGDAAKLRRKFEQLYGNSPGYRAALEQLYTLHAGLRAGFEQNYSVSEGQVRAALEQFYNIQDKDLLRATLDMLYVLAAGEALVQRFDIKVTCDGIVHNSMSNINVEQDDNSFHMTGDLQLYDEAEALQYRPFASAVAITVDGWTCRLICGFMREARTPGQTVYVVPLYSRTILLDAPHSRLAAGELSGMASALVAALAAPFTVSWQLVDWFIPAGRLAVNEGDAAISVIRRITEAVGGIIQTDPDGVLICRPEYPVSVDKWETATPDCYLTDQDDFFQVDHAPEMRDGYNLVQVSDQQLTTGGLTLEVTTIDHYVSEVRVYQVPWDDDSIIRLRHSGDPSRVAIVAHGVRTEPVTAERVEIVAGSGRTSKPFYRLVSADYREAELGGITIAEDGSVTTATAGNSLVAIGYETRCWLFTVTDHTAEDVQFFPEESAA